MAGIALYFAEIPSMEFKQCVLNWCDSTLNNHEKSAIFRENSVIFTDFSTENQEMC